MNRKQEIISALSGLLSDSNAVHRCLATQTLGRLNDMSSFQVLMDRLYDEDPDVCHDAIEALGELGDQGAVDILTLISNTADLGDIRVAALKSLIRIGGPEVAGLLLKVAGERDPSWDYLIEDTWDNYWDAQLLAVEALGRMGEERVVPLIRGILEDEYSQEISAQCITALKNCGPSGFELLMERLKAGQAIERRRIIEVMGQMEAPGVREALREALNDSDGEVRTIALEIIGDQLSADELVRLSRDSYPEVRAGVVDFLRLHSPVEHAKVWFRFLGDPSEDVRAATVAVLPGLMGRQSLTHLVKALEDDYQEVAVSAIEALGDLGGEAALAALMNETIRPGSAPLPRLTALEEMARYDDPEVRERLLLLLKDDDPAIRMASLEALSGEEGQRDKEFLFSVLRGEIVLEEQPEQPEQVEGGEEAETGEELSAHSDAAGSSEDQPGDEDLPAGQPAQTQAAQTQAAQTQAAQDQTVPEDPSEEQAEAAAESRPADMASSDGLEDDSRVLPADTGSG
ncbi:MAG: HEAT repeat domain-containing protein, partial [Deltaproteobacteria bacterium]|nr:HEAT repeat domain-containing protein [Deltaproteobacteria bacterium]